MKSKITIDLDFDNQPVIKIDYQHSEDVRDKMVKRFLETFGYTSAWAKITFEESPSDGSKGDTSVSRLRPIPENEIIEYNSITWDSSSTGITKTTITQ